MRNTILTTLGLTVLLGIWGCQSKEPGPSPAASPTAEAPPAAPGGAPGGPAMPGAPGEPGPAMTPPGMAGPAAPTAPAEAEKPDAAKPAEKPAAKEDNSDDPFSSSMTTPPSKETGKIGITGALGRAFLRAAAAGGNANSSTK